MSGIWGYLFLDPDPTTFTHFIHIFQPTINHICANSTNLLFHLSDYTVMVKSVFFAHP